MFYSLCLVIITDLSKSANGGSYGFQYNGKPLEVWQITTQDFGDRWGTCPCEKKAKVAPSSIRTLDDFVNRMNQFSVHTVEAIPTSAFFSVGSLKPVDATVC